MVRILVNPALKAENSAQNRAINFDKLTQVRLQVTFPKLCKRTCGNTLYEGKQAIEFTSANWFDDVMTCHQLSTFVPVAPKFPVVERLKFFW